MKTLVLLCALPAAAPACEKTRIEHLGQSEARIVACYQAAQKTPAKPSPATPSAPAKKPSPKDRDPRPTPPAHLFM